MRKHIVVLFAFAAVFAAGAAEMITAREATGIAEGVVAAVSADDAGRALPKYLGAFAFEDTYAEDAAWYYGQLDSFGGACSARRIGNVLERNYDWFYDESATFVVTVTATDTRFASIGVASVGSRITADAMESRTWSRYWRCLPGATLDGINACGVGAEINVVSTNGSPWETKGERDINAIGAVRWVLDYASSARQAAAELAARVYIPEVMKRKGYSAHFAVCDATESWVVEDGVATIRPGGVPAVLTNFRALDPDEPYGTGYERYLMLTNEAVSITSAWFRAAYRRPFSRPTEFAAPGVGAWTETDRLLAWAEANVPSGAPETLERGGGSWQTVHCSVYDLEEKTLKVAVQETDDWYEFSLPPSQVTPIPSDAADMATYVALESNEVTGVVKPEDNNGSVVIGKGASGTINPAYLSKPITKRTEFRSEAIAIGHNATVVGSSSTRAQGIAVGWCAKAQGSNAIAIGAGARHWYETDADGHSTYANGSEAIAVGYSAKSLAGGAIQLGKGLNTEKNTLKFRDTVIVKDGKVQGGSDTNAVREIVSDELDPKVATATNLEVTVKSHALTTVSPDEDAVAGEELFVSATGTRNFEVYLPNTPELRVGLPISFNTDIAGEVTKLGPWWTNKVTRLPAKVKMKEPLPKTLILEVEQYETDWDWTPVVTQACQTNGEVMVEGTNLHFAAAARIGGIRHELTNPLYGIIHVFTNGVVGASGELVGADGETIAEFVVE